MSPISAVREHDSNSMTRSLQIPDDTSLTAQSRAIASLVRALVRDVHEAEDVAQDAWVALLSSSAQQSAEWLRGTVRNLARRSHRDQQRHRSLITYGAVSTQTSGMTSDDVAEQVEVQRDIADALMAIGEPYRTVVVLRYWHGLPPRRIAVELGRPEATIKTQLQRGLSLLRKQLDRVHGRDRWIAALWPWVVPSATTRGITAVIGVGSVMMKVAAICVALLALLGLGHSWWPDSDPPDKAGVVQPTSPRTNPLVDRIVGSEQRPGDGLDTIREAVEPSIEKEAGSSEMLSLFVIVATHGSSRQVADAMLRIESEYSDLPILRTLAATWLMADSEAGEPGLRNQYAVGALFADRSETEFETYRQQGCGGALHVELRQLLSVPVENPRALLSQGSKAVTRILDALYARDPCAARALAIRLIQAAFRKGTAMWVMDACVRNDQPAALVAMLRALGDHHISKMAASERRFGVHQVESEVAMTFTLALERGSLSGAQGREKLRGLSDLLSSRLQAGTYTVTEGLMAAYSLSSLGLGPGETLSHLALLARDGANPILQSTAWRRMAPHATPSLLIALANPVCKLPMTEPDSCRQTDLFRALFEVYESNGDREGVTAALLRERLREPASTSWGRLHQLSVMQRMPRGLRSSLRSELESMARSRHTDLSLAARKVLGSVLK